MKTVFTTQPSSDREKKNLLFLNLIRKHKSTSRTEISKLTNINMVTVSNYVNGYLKKGLVLERGYDASSGGRRPELVELNREWGYAIGIDIGKSYIKGALVDLGLGVLASESTHGYEKENLKSSIAEMVKKLLAASKIDQKRVKKIGIGVSANSGGIAEDIIKAEETIGGEAKIPALAGDAALCAASGEKNLNPEAMETSSILYVYTDLGKGVFIKDDEFYEAVTEEDHYPYLRPWDEGLSIASEAKKIVKQGMGTRIVDIAQGNAKNITLETVVKAAKQKDEIAMDLVRMVGMNLGVRIAYLINALEPGAVIVGGGIEKAGNLFLEPLTSSINRFILQKALNKVRVALATLGEEACAKGSAFLAIREAFIET